MRYESREAFLHDYPGLMFFFTTDAFDQLLYWHNYDEMLKYVKALRHTNYKYSNAHLRFFKQNEFEIGKYDEFFKVKI